VLRYCDNDYVGGEIGTIGADFKVKFVKSQKKTVKLQIWDTAGQEKFRDLTVSYFAGANAVVVAFDLSDKSTLDFVDKWIQEAKKFVTGTELKFLILGNKSDRDDIAAGIEQAAGDYCVKKGVIYHRVSAKTGSGVEEAFAHLTQELLTGLKSESLK